MTDYDYSTTLDALKLLKELSRAQGLSDFSKLIAGGLIIDAEIAHITGIPTVGPQGIAWALERVAEIEAENGKKRVNTRDFCKWLASVLSTFFAESFRPE